MRPGGRPGCPDSVEVVAPGGLPGGALADVGPLLEEAIPELAAATTVEVGSPLTLPALPEGAQAAAALRAAVRLFLLDVLLS